ncbi:hypothetical protein JHD50_00245 [Sulfurimonas sp. MAG313]|nr:hypothetical protein [Sulfurimonas sp. MAG313]MDF1879742.1 hypothetical protein [Sulfurimonas sp. MAG313]
MKKLVLITLALATLIFSGCSSKKVVVGYDGPEEVSAYFVAPLMSTDEVKSALVAQGFEIVSVSKVSKKKLDSIVFTHPHLKTLASKPSRGFLAGAMRVLVNTEDKEVRITNPRYFTRAFLQDDYKVNDEKPLLEAIHKAFPNTTMSEDKWKFDGLADYHFMLGMPYYHDPIEIKEGTIEELQAKLEKKAKKRLIFKMEISEGKVLYGVNLGKRNMKFVDKIGIKNAALLPWMILIENTTKEDGTVIAQATALPADYYIAITYPLLDMGGFMGIMTMPGAVIKEMTKLFK